MISSRELWKTTASVKRDLLQALAMTWAQKKKRESNNEF
jgi:hypothetical protein